MIIINTKNFKSIDQALKFYKQKHNKIGIVKELRDRQEFTKPSIKQRDKLLKAQYKQKLHNTNKD
jgi:small subunit ribosomal protein S21